MPFGINADGSFPEIGARYDFGLATRDASNLNCKNKDGTPVPVQRMAYMVSIDKQKTTKEATELQEKSRLVQLGTSTSIDREFDQWVQNTQGDWSGGAGQRVWGKDGINNQYFDGQGLLWPINDYIPQVPFPQTPVTVKPAGVLTVPKYRGIAGGFLAGAGNGYALVYGIVNGGNWDLHVRFYYADSMAEITMLVNGTWTPLALFVAHGSIWMVAADLVAGGIIALYRLDWTAGPALSITSTTNIVTNLLANSSPAPQAIATGAIIGSRIYIAVSLAYRIGATNWSNSITILDFTAGPSTAPTVFPLPLPSDQKYSIVDLNFQGGQLYTSVSDGYTASILITPPPFAQTATVAVMPGFAFALLTSVGSTLFIVSYNTSPNGLVQNIMLYSLSSGALTEIGPLYEPNETTIAVSSPLTFDSYALWVTIHQPTGSATKTIDVHAYDVSRGRLFKALTVASAAFLGSGVIAHEVLAVFGATNRSCVVGGNTGTYSAQWGFALYTEAISTNPGQPPVEMAEEFYFGVQPLTPAPTFQGLLQMGSDIISGIFDFTASSKKLFRQELTDFINGLVVGAASPSVQLNIWFDQDPGQLASVPDVTINTGSPVAPLPSVLKAVSNRVARKLVYEAISTGGGFVNNVWRNAPKLVDVVIQAATGWVWDLVADLNPNVRTNTAGQQEYAYTQQSPTDPTSLSYDHVVAYNFLKQLWRQKGGECTIYLPNGDTYPALIQLEEFDSPKPIAGVGRSDVQPTWQVICTLKIREDI